MRVPSHTVIRGNERAGCLARAAIYGDAPTTTTVIHTDMKHFLKTILSKAWQAEWDITDTKLSKVKKSVLPQKITPKKRRHQVMLTRLWLGHAELTHEYLVTCSSQPTFEICEARLKMKHILCDCSLHYQERINHQIP
ncbi:hypothetical protein JTB14_035446 [Gonioctena quinquepunctata]|nr:hypothetical protein JTB14_035446 [Gonioctena quinquepunctata]